MTDNPDDTPAPKPRPPRAKDRPECELDEETGRWCVRGHSRDRAVGSLLDLPWSVPINQRFQGKP